LHDGSAPCSDDEMKSSSRSPSVASPSAHRLLAAALLFALGTLSACAADDPKLGACGTSADCRAGQMCVDNRCIATRDGGGTDLGGGSDTDSGPPRTITALAIVPPTPIVVSVDGARTTLDLDAQVTYDDGTTALVSSAFWSIASTRLGAIDATTGIFTADGEVAGTVEVSVEAIGMTATTTLSVQIERTVIAPGAPADAPTRFDAATVVDDAARRATLLYPLGGTVFPQNVQPPDVQWEGGVATDLYRVRMTAPGATVRAYVLHDGAPFRFDWLVTREAWRAVAENTPETDVTIAVDRLETATGSVINGVPRTFRFAEATIRGAIYYWDLGGGNVQRIRGDGTGREVFMPTPPANPANGSRCVACHAISRDGRRMAAEMWEGGGPGAIYDLTIDLTADPAPAIVPPSVVSFLTASFSPDNLRLVANNATELFLIDGNSGARLPAGGAGLPATGSAHPTWSPDGTQIAYSANHEGGWGVDFRTADLGIIDITGVDAFASPRTIFGGAGLAVARPTWSPNSALIAFQHSEHSRIREDLGTGAASIPRAGVVSVVTRDGATQWPLAALNDGATRNSYYPTFSPFDEGGYFWLAFVTTRDYGNAQAGTRGTGRRQLWVAAIRNAPMSGVDPSFAPYWLPQQDVAHENMAAFWAEEACRADTRGCATSGECCSGFCRDTGAGPVCVPPDIVECSETGEACRTNADCCAGAGDCSANVCSTLG